MAGGGRQYTFKELEDQIQKVLTSLISSLLPNVELVKLFSGSNYLTNKLLLWILVYACTEE